MPDPTNPNPDSSRTQCNRILEFMREGNSLTGLEALTRFGCIHLPRRILDLKERGHHIGDEFIRLESGKRVKRYYLVESIAA